MACWVSGYYGAVAWVDYLVGELLRELDVLGQANNTVVSTFDSLCSHTLLFACCCRLWLLAPSTYLLMSTRCACKVAFIGDHGYQLGEHNIWGKVLGHAGVLPGYLSGMFLTPLSHKYWRLDG